KYSKAGYAVVISKSENKAAFIDLQPLFQYYKAMYFGARSDFDRTRNLGAAANQWPYTFDYAPAQSPLVVKVIDLADHPTAVNTNLYGGYGITKAYIATLDGTLSTYEVGGLASGAAANPGDIRAVATMQLGKN